MSKGRLSGSVAAALACLALGGCASSASDPASLIPTQLAASVMAEDRLLGSQAGGKPVTVDEMLDRARRGDGQPGTTQAQPQAAGEHPVPPNPEAAAAQAAQGQPGAGGSPQSQAQAMLAQTPPAKPGESSSKDFFEVTFDGQDEQPAAAVADALARKVKGAKLSAKTEVTILAGPAAGTTAFDQALLANKRARNVRSLLPEGWKISQVYDPNFPPDTVRIVLGSKS